MTHVSVCAPSVYVGTSVLIFDGMCESFLRLIHLLVVVFATHYQMFAHACRNETTGHVLIGCGYASKRRLGH